MARIEITGRATADAELRYTASGKAVAAISVADNHRKRGQDGTWADDGTTYYRVNVWEAAAEALAETPLKGRRVLITGDLRTREYETRDGRKGQSLEVGSATVAIIPTANASGRGLGATQSHANGQDGPWGTQAGNGPQRPVQDPWTADQFPADPPF